MSVGIAGVEFPKHQPTPAAPRSHTRAVVAVASSRSLGVSAITAVSYVGSAGFRLRLDVKNGKTAHLECTQKRDCTSPAIWGIVCAAVPVLVWTASHGIGRLAAQVERLRDEADNRVDGRVRSFL